VTLNDYTDQRPQGLQFVETGKSAVTSRNIHLALLATVATLAACGDNNKYQAPPPAEVTVARPVQRKVTLYVEFTGTTSASKKVDLLARVQGYLEKIGYIDGQPVKKDQTLFAIERAPYETSLKIAEASVAQQQAQVTQADADLSRQVTLNQQQYAAQAKLDTSRAARDSAAAALDQAKGQVRQAQINLGYTEIRAPFDGVVSARLADLGALVGPSGPGGPTKLATIFQVAPIYATFTVGEQQVLQIREQLRSEGKKLEDISPIPVEVGLQTEQGFPHAGAIDYIAPDIDASTGTLTVRAVIPNADHALAPGLFVRVRSPSQRNIEAMLVPDAAIGTAQSGRYVLIVNDKNIVEQRSVDTGDLVEGRWRLVKSGLTATERVVIGGLQRAIPGNVVAPTEAPKAAAPAPGQGK
jgi:membrane fusion protein, multidrug efflux system